jgi:RNA polymerase sigma factor for flagellar operon FliA
MGAATAKQLDHSSESRVVETSARPTTAHDPSSIEDRNAAIMRYMPLVRFVAQRVNSSLALPTGVDFHDLVSWGLLGLLESWERFDPERGVKFETFAAPRIRGAIVDEIGHHDWLQRYVRTRARCLSGTEATLTAKLGRQPTRDEVAELMGADGLEQVERGGPPAVLIGLEDVTCRGADAGEGISVSDTLADTGERPGDAMEAVELRDQLAEALKSLDERDRLILTLYYFEGMQLGDVAKILGVTESRISQLHRRSLHLLRGQLVAA